MFNTIQNNKMVEVLSGPERRRRRAPQEKIAIIQQTMEPGMTVSHVARLHGINANQLFKWRRQYEDGSLTAVTSAEKSSPLQNLLLPISKSADFSVFWAKKRWKPKYSRRPWSSAGQKNGLRMRPCCQRTTNKRRQPQYWCVACETQSQDPAFARLAGSQAAYQF